MELPSRRSTSKIARLPANVRQTINTMLNDGHSYPAIVARLTELGHPEITKQNLSSWSTTGFRQWLAEQHRLDEINAETDSVAALLKDHDPSTTLNEANEIFLSSHLHRLLLRFDAKFASRCLARNPLKFFELAKAVIDQATQRTRRKRAALAERKYEDQLTKEKQHQEASKPAPIITDPSDDHRRIVVDLVNDIMGTKREPNVAQGNGDHSRPPIGENQDSENRPHPSSSNSIDPP